MADNSGGGAITDFFLQLGFDVSKVDEGLVDLATKLRQFSSQTTLKVGVKATGVNQLTRLKNAATNLQGRLDRQLQGDIFSFGSGFEKLNDEMKETQALDTYRQALAEVRKAMERLETSAGRTPENLEAAKTAMDHLRNASSNLKRENRELEKTFGQQNFVVRSLVHSLKNLARSWLSVFAIIKGGKMFTEVGQKVMAARASLRMISDTTEEAGKHFEFVASTAASLGADLEVVTRNFSRFGIAAKKAGLDLEDTKDIFLGVAEATTAYQMSQQETLLTYRAFDQMLSRGTVSMEEVRKQLGNNMPAAFYTAAEAMGYTEKKFDNLVVNGKVASKDFVLNFSRHLREVVRQNGTLDEALTTSKMAQQKFHQAWNATVADIFSSGMDNYLYEFFTTLHNFVDNIKPQLRAFATLFGAIIRIISTLIRTVSALTKGFNATAKSIWNSTSLLRGFVEVGSKGLDYITQKVFALTKAFEMMADRVSKGEGSFLDNTAVWLTALASVYAAYKTILFLARKLSLVRLGKALVERVKQARAGRTATGGARQVAASSAARGGVVRAVAKWGLTRLIAGLSGFFTGGAGWVLLAGLIAKDIYDVFQYTRGSKQEGMENAVKKSASTSSMESSVNNISINIDGSQNPEQVAFAVKREIRSMLGGSYA